MFAAALTFAMEMLASPRQPVNKISLEETRFLDMKLGKALRFIWPCPAEILTPRDGTCL